MMLAAGRALEHAAHRVGLESAGPQALKLAWWRRLLDMKKAAEQPVKDVELP